MKKFFTVFFVLLFFFFFSENISAVEKEDIKEILSEKLNVSDIENVPETSIENAESFGEELSVDNVSVFFDVGKIFSFIFNMTLSVISSKKEYIMSLVSILALTFFFSKLGQGLSSERTLSVARNLTALFAAATVFFPLWNVVTDCMRYGGEISSFSLSFVPVFSAVLAASGYPTVASGSIGGLLFTVEFFSAMLSSAVPVLVGVFLSVGIASGISGDDGLKKISAVVRNIISLGITAVYFIITSAISLNSGILSGNDGMVRKGLKFVVGSSVPVAGGFLSDGMDSVYSAAEVLKRNCGGFLCVVIFLIASAPVLELIVCGICMKICSAFSSFFGCGSLENFFSVSFDAYTVVLSFVLGGFITESAVILIISRLGG